MNADPTKNTAVQINNNGNTLVIGNGGSLLTDPGAVIDLSGAAPPGAGTIGTGVVAAESGLGAHKTVLTFVNNVIATTDHGAAGAQGNALIYTFPAGVIEILGAEIDLTTQKGAGGLTTTAALVASLGTVAADADDGTLHGTEANIVPSVAGTLVASAGAFLGKTLPTLATLLGVNTLTDSSAGTPADAIAVMADSATAGGATPTAAQVDTSINTLLAIFRNNFASLAAKVNNLLNMTFARQIFDGTITPVPVQLNIAVPDAGSAANDTVTVNGTITLYWLNHGVPV